MSLLSLIGDKDISGFPPEINVSVVAFENNMKIWERKLRTAIGEHKVGGLGPQLIFLI